MKIARFFPHLWPVILCSAVALQRLVGAADFPTPTNSETAPGSPMKAEEAAATMGLPDGFKARVFAAEPDVQNPIAMAWDSKGRLWIAENYTYAEAPRRFDLSLRDRILIFEDETGEGRFTKRRVFADGLQMLTSIEVGRGGVWAMCPPQLLFIPTAPGSDAPSGAPKVVLDGFNVPAENYHNYANGLRWGPDGWLYGRCGASAPGEVGVPGSPAHLRVPLRGGMWRFHPERGVFEAINSGTTNPWGHDWDKFGELFFINTVNGHLWHGITGAHLVRGATADPNTRAYAQIDQHADHWHFDTSQGWTKSRDGAANALGGGHAHIGAMIYKGNNWPEPYRDSLYTFNMHGLRMNREVLERLGSGYVGKHGGDFMTAGDPWFRGLDLSCSPDGAVFAIDWSDTGECHERNGVHRTSGRIFKIQHGDLKPRRSIDMRLMGAAELVEALADANEWQASMARRILAERGRGVGVAGDTGEKLLMEVFEGPSPLVVKLRAMWTLFGLGSASSEFLLRQLYHPDEHVRAWAVRFLSDQWSLDTVMSQRPAGADTGRETAFIARELEQLALREPSGLVRLALASTLQRLPVELRAGLAKVLVSRAADAADHNLPALVWYGLIPLADAEPSALLPLYWACEWPLTRRLMARRLAELIETHPAALNGLLAGLKDNDSNDVIADALNGIADGLKGWRKAPKPEAWDGLAVMSEKKLDSGVQEKLRDLSVLFGDGRALDEVRKVALDKTAELAARRSALQTLVESRAPDLRLVCEELLSTRFLNPIAARGLATFDDAGIGEKLARAYASFHQTERPQLVATILSRASFIPSLLSAIEAGRIPRTALSAFDVRQIRGFNDAALNGRLAAVWGELRETGEDKKAAIANYKNELGPEVIAAADRSRGRVLFQTVCGACHMLYGEGGRIGPDLTGAGRDNLDYLLENIVDPSAVVGADFRMTVVSLKDGRVLSGMLRERSERTFTVQAMVDSIVVERSDVAGLQEMQNSLMPEGLLDSLTREQRRDLIGYLIGRSQAPLPGSP